jgi:hypothetical protein
MDRQQLRDSLNLGNTVKRDLGRLRKLAAERGHGEWVELIQSWERATDEQISRLTLREYGNT